MKPIAKWNLCTIRKAQVFESHGQSRIVFDTDWQYEAMVTPLSWEPLDVWRFYNQRCCMCFHFMGASFTYVRV
jgi:hypothetical protein